ncbi:MAG: hypothetical protein IPM29_19835 [Planctomycetes bacterium]|nr:hypothetical protein [Planctomycetota bacterium]
MVLSRSVVARRLVLLEPDAFGVLVAVSLVILVAIARCTRCRTRARVLPCDVLPRKVYGLAVIEHAVALYAVGDRSLRQVAWSLLGETTPAHGTLHGWTEGFGAYALGRPGGDAGGAPMSRFVAEAEARVPEIAGTMRAHVDVDPRRYRSEARRDRLAALLCAVVLIRLVAGVPPPHAAAECRRLTLLWSTSSVLCFRSRIACTPIEHPDRSMPPGSRAPATTSRDPCPTRTRSPPGASSRSLF